MNVVFWGPAPISHLNHTWTEFQNINNQPLLVVIGEYLNDIRKNLGWKSEDIINANQILLNRNGWWEQGKKIIDNNLDAVHTFFGFWRNHKYFPLIIYALWNGVKVAILNESYSEINTGYLKEEAFIVSWIKANIRPFLYKLFALILKSASKYKPPCILSISPLARSQFIRAGFDENTIFPFGYFVKKDFVSKHELEYGKNHLKLVFVGRIVKGKGLDIAIEAIDLLYRRGIKVHLDIYGAGRPDENILQAPAHIQFKGVLSQDVVQQVISQYDFLILPSRYDGWGVVVNEALLQGVPVIISDRVGAKCLIEDTKAGIIFRSEDVQDLTTKLEQLAQDPKKVEDMKIQALQMESLILPEVAARYLYNVFNFYFYQNGNVSIPEAIWCDAGKQR